MNESDIFKNHMVDLSRVSYERGIYSYSDFLTLAEQSDLALARQEGKLYANDYSVFGGCEGAERVMARFGTEETLGYDEPWPIVCIEVRPLNRKFAEDLSHRDVLGSLMNLGIERGLLGDIIMPGEAGESIYFFAREHIADTLCRELIRIRHTSVIASIADNAEGEIAPKFKEITLQIKSDRIDLVTAHLYKLSRSQAAELFLAKKIFVNGRLMENESYNLKEGDVVSVRGFGRFIYKGITGTTKKGNLNATLLQYV